MLVLNKWKMRKFFRHRWLLWANPTFPSIFSNTKTLSFVLAAGEVECSKRWSLSLFKDCARFFGTWLRRSRPRERPSVVSGIGSLESHPTNAGGGFETEIVVFEPCLISSSLSLQLLIELLISLTSCISPEIWSFLIVWGGWLIPT